jgi:hypothetical protein
VGTLFHGRLTWIFVAAAWPVAVLDPLDVEPVEVGVLPAHDGLQGPVEGGELHVPRDLEPPPDPGHDVEEGDLQLVDLPSRCGRARLDNSHDRNLQFSAMRTKAF